MNAGSDAGAMPANVSLNMRPNAAAGFANDVEDVNQYADPMYAATAVETRLAGARAMTSTRPAVATTSAIHWPAPPRAFAAHCTAGRSNMRLASAAPSAAPASWAAT